MTPAALRRWIRRQQARFQAQPRQSAREMVRGESHYYLGRRYRLVLADTSGRQSVSLQGATRLVLHAHPGADAASRWRVLERWYRKQLHALLAPLIDDAGRWTDVALEFMCDPGTRVLVDGQALKSGEPVPAQAFVLRWDMGHCQPYGHAIALTGAVRLVVSRGDEGFIAQVVPDRLWIGGPLGQVPVVRPFTATLSLAESARASLVPAPDSSIRSPGRRQSLSSITRPAGDASTTRPI